MSILYSVDDFWFMFRLIFIFTFCLTFKLIKKSNQITEIIKYIVENLYKFVILIIIFNLHINYGIYQKSMIWNERITNVFPVIITLEPIHNF